MKCCSMGVIVFVNLAGFHSYFISLKLDFIKIQATERRGCIYSLPSRNTPKEMVKMQKTNKKHAHFAGFQLSISVTFRVD